jgi:hypothetical protein
VVLQLLIYYLLITYIPANMKKYIALLLIFFCVIKSNSQSASFLKTGTCTTVLSYINKQVNNDSLTIEIFRKNYSIERIDTNILFKKKPFEIINFFKQDENSNLTCSLKRIKYNTNVLLIK